MKLNDRQRSALARLVAEAQHAQARVGEFVTAAALALDLDPSAVQFDMSTMTFAPRPAPPPPVPVRPKKPDA